MANPLLGGGNRTYPLPALSHPASGGWQGEQEEKAHASSQQRKGAWEPSQADFPQGMGRGIGLAPVKEAEGRLGKIF